MCGVGFVSLIVVRRCWCLECLVYWCVIVCFGGVLWIGLVCGVINMVLYFLLLMIRRVLFVVYLVLCCRIVFFLVMICLFWVFGLVIVLILFLVYWMIGLLWFVFLWVCCVMVSCRWYGMLLLVRCFGKVYDYWSLDGYMLFRLMWICLRELWGNVFVNLWFGVIVRCDVCCWFEWCG